MNGEKFALMKGNKFLSNEGDFTSPGRFHESTKQFESEDAALDAAVAKGIHLDFVKVLTIHNKR